MGEASEVSLSMTIWRRREVDVVALGTVFAAFDAAGDLMKAPAPSQRAALRIEKEDRMSGCVSKTGVEVFSFFLRQLERRE